MARLARKNPTNENIPVAEIRIDPKYQRELVTRWVERLAANWDETKVGLICVSARRDGLFYVIDGQHRYEAALRNGVQSLPAEIWYDLAEAEEAGMFVGRNETRGVRRIDKFMAAVVAGAPDQCNIKKIVEDTGWRINDMDEDGSIRAIASLERLYGVSDDPDKERRPDTLRRTLEVLHRAWGYNQDAAAGYLIDGLGRFLVRYDQELDFDKLIRKLSKYNGGPTALVGRSKELRSFIRTTVPNCVAELLVETYNVGLRTNKLPAWRS